MKNLPKILIALPLIFLISLKSEAAPYFAKEVINPTLIDPPFSRQSSEFKNEIKQIIKLQKKADANEVKKALRERNLSVEMVAQDVDTNLSQASYPKLYQLLTRTNETSKEISENVKNYWKTDRPYIADKRIKALIEAHNNPAYPSGHTCGSYVLAHVLSLLIPNQRQMFYARAEEIAQHRVLVGMHFPKDLDGGRQLALLIVGALLQNEQFEKDFKSAQKELAQNPLPSITNH